MMFNLHLEKVNLKTGKNEDINIGNLNIGFETDAEEIRQMMADNELLLDFMKPSIAEAMNMAREDKAERRKEITKAVDAAFSRLAKVENKIDKLYNR